MNILVNTRSLGAPISGVQRYTQEILGQWEGRVALIAPQQPLAGLRGHAWEQLVLPLCTQGKLLWSPANTGPLGVAHQVVTVHDLAALEHPEWFNSRFASWYRVLIPHLCRRARAVITISQFTRDRLVAWGISAEKIHVVPNGVGSRFFEPVEKSADTTMAELKLPAKNYVLGVSSVEPRKNLWRLVQAWARICDEMPDTWLVLAGAQGASRIFRESGLGTLPERVHFTGYIPDTHLPALYHHARAFCYVSLYEGFGLPPLEAMATGVPTLVANTTALAEFVGQGALGVDPNKVEEIANGMLSITRDKHLRSSLIDSGRKQAKGMTWSQSAEKTMNVLQQYQD